MSEKQSNIDLAVNAFMANRSQSLRSMISAMSSDTKHPQCWSDYGYPAHIGFHDLYTMYKRNGLARAGVELLPDKCWQSLPWVRNVEDRKQKETAWEKAFSQLASRLDLWANTKMLDYRQRVGRYAAFLVIVADDKDWSQPITGNLTPDAIKQIIPLYESQIEVVSSYQDPKVESYGLPEIYQYNESAIGDDNPDSNRVREVHESRVITWAEGASGNSIYGIPTLEAGFNNLLNIDKIDGAGGEGFWKNARTPMSLNINDDADVHSIAAMYGCEPAELAEKLGEKIGDYNRGLDNTLMLKGMTSSINSISLPNPKEFIESNKKSFAASIKTPLTLLEGNQSGNQASAENGSTFDEQAESRRVNEIDRFIKKFIKWLERYNVLKKNDQYFIYWDSLLEPSMGEKLANAMIMVDANQKAIGTGMIYFTADEIREMVGKEPLTIEENAIDDVEPED